MKLSTFLLPPPAVVAASRSRCHLPQSLPPPAFVAASRSRCRLPQSVALAEHFHPRNSEPGLHLKVTTYGRLEQRDGCMGDD